jgi:hypothetical protein
VGDAGNGFAPERSAKETFLKRASLPCVRALPRCCHGCISDIQSWKPDTSGTRS